MTTFNLPVNIIFGNDVLLKLKEFSFPFIVCDPFFINSDILKKVTDNFKEFTCFSDFSPDPSLESVAKGITAFLRKPHMSVIAIGGGSAIDTAKAILYLKKEDTKIPFIAIPTTSGTGSEVTSFSVVTDKSTNSKYPLVSDKMLPDIAILDVDFVKSVPKPVSADTGADVLCHALESYVSKDANAFTDALCEKTVRILFTHLKKAVDGDLYSKEQVHFASTLAGLAFDKTNLGLCHSMAHNIGARLKIPHGRTNAILLPEIIKFNAGDLSYSASPSKTALKYAELSTVLGNSGSVPILVRKLISDISHLFSSIGLPKTFNAKDKQDLAPIIAKSALLDGCMKGNPVTATENDIIKIYKEVLS